jgi:hypothetical protein
MQIDTESACRKVASDCSRITGELEVMPQAGLVNRRLETAFEGMGRAVGSDPCQTCSDAMQARHSFAVL